MMETPMQRSQSLCLLSLGFSLAACMLLDAQRTVPQGAQGALPTGSDRMRARLGQAPEGPTIGLGFKPHKAEGNLPDCVEIVLVEPGSVADHAGLQVGDLVLSVNGRPMPTTRHFLMALAPGVQRTVTLEVRRGGSPLSILLPIAAVAAVAGGSGVDPFAVPGLARTPQTKAGINTLRTVFIDPKTGSLAFLGTYDPAFATGPIDYATLLGDALRSPYPAFSLDPSPATKANRETLIRKVDADMAQVQRDLAYGKAWMLRIGTMLLSDPTLGLDRQRFLKKGAEAMGTTPDHVRAFWDLASGRTQSLSPEGLNMVAALFVKMGTPEIGQALQAMQNGNAVGGIELLGLGPLLSDTRQKMQAGTITKEFASALMQAAFWEQVMVRLKVPEASWRASVNRVKAGREPLETFLPAVENLLSGAITDRVMLPWLNGLVLSQAFLERFYQVPSVESVPVCLSGLAPDSELARTFFAADWNLKMLAISPELAEKVSGHVTFLNYEFRLASSRGIYAPGSAVEVRNWLSPQGVELRHDPSGSVVTFGPSRIAIRSEWLTFEGGSRSASALEREALDAYAKEITRRYDEYARALPELHRLREAAKVLALVRWAKNRNQLLASPGPLAPEKPLPSSFRQGFWTATFQADANKILFVIAAHGGVEFDQKAGDAWVQPRAEAGLADSALKQLVGSAALAQQAVLAAENGDLEGARALAQKSEQAMIGDLSSGFPPLGKIPEVPEPATLAVFQSQALDQTREAITGLAQTQAKAQTLSQTPGPDTAALMAQVDADKRAWEQKLRNLKELMAQGQRNPASASQLVVQLRPGGMGTLAPVAGGTTVTPAPAPVTSPVAAKPVINPEERARILNEIGQLRNELCRVQASLRRFNATIQSDQNQRAEWEQVTNEAYQRAIDQVKDAVMDELKDLSMDLPNGYLEDKLAKASTKEDQERIKGALRLVQHLKESYALKDFSVWASYEDYSRDEIIEGAKMVAELTGIDEWIKNKLVKKWGLGRVLAFGEAAQDIVASAYDVTSEVLAWRRLNQLNRNSDSFLKAVEATSRRMKSVMEGIRERELRLGLAPGATKEACPQ
jgi:hypothetical protein